MKLSPRQYGILKPGDRLEDIMAESDPYPKNLKNNSMDEYRMRCLQVCQLLRMLLAAQNRELRVSFPCVEFQCLSAIANPDNPGFVLVYSGKRISSLGEDTWKSYEGIKTPPSSKTRQLMALNLAKAIWHSTLQIKCTVVLILTSCSLTSVMLMTQHQSKKHSLLLYWRASRFRETLVDNLISLM